MSVRSVLAAVAGDIRAQADLLNELDGASGDGDLGVTMSLAATALLRALESLPPGGVAEALRACGAAVAREAPSTSGTLVATGLLRAAGAAMDESEPAAELAARFAAAVDGIQERGGAEVGSKTMLDALVPARDAANRAAAAGEASAAVLAAAAAAADTGAALTVEMRPKHGRAGWLADRSAGHEDAGARMVAIALASAAEHTASAASLQ
ncbi:MAG TPA: DAK2 domain-containing protein [Gaiellaceae bacterium]|nr:DAK2 domain-containing protein [Gaiellaceae bacterium]